MEVSSFDVEKVILQTLPAEKVSEAAVLAAAAFLYTNSCVYIYGDDIELRRRELEWLFEKNISLMYERNPAACFCGIDNSVTPGRLCCFFMLLSPEESDISLCQKVMTGLLWLPLRVGYSTFQRLVEVADYADISEVEMATPGSPFLRLGRMVVHPDYQGKGLPDMQSMWRHLYNIKFVQELAVNAFAQQLIASIATG
jgi:hypothetical protein